ncbi:MAG TPA: LptE family protein [Cyclobacteriaceae bacterium]|nr:LptE family protein [Cyclobacteriaceae bacterium]
MKKNNSSVKLYSSLFALFLLFTYTSCGVYSLSGASTLAKTISVAQFYNNTDLAPANLAQTFTNRLKDYYQRNSSLTVVTDGAELQIEGTIVEYKLAPMAPTSSGSTTTNDAAALTRLSIGIRTTYVDNLNAQNNFKDKVFSFYADFPNTQNFTTIQEDLEKKIFDQILIDIFNATLANW